MRYICEYLINYLQYKRLSMNNFLTNLFIHFIRYRKFQLVLFLIISFTKNIYSQNIRNSSILLRDSLYSLEVQPLDLGQFTFDEIKKMGLSSSNETELNFEKWRLPTIEEFYFMYKNMNLIPDLTSGNYWSCDMSSFDYSNNESKTFKYITKDWLFNFKSGLKHSNYGKTRSGEKFYVRLVRKSSFKLWEPYSSNLIANGNSGIVSLKYLPENYNGQAVDYYQTGQIKKRINYLNGEKDRFYYLYFPNGQIKMKVSFIRGKEDGNYLSFWSNGTIEVKGLFKDGKFHGKWEYFNQNGQLHYSVFYENGKLISSEVKKFRENGTCYELTSYVDENNYSFQSYFENGQISQSQVIKNGFILTRELFYDNGELLNKETRQNGNLKSIWVKADPPNEYIYIKNGRYGLRDSTGTEITGANYDSIGVFNSKNISVFTSGKKYGLIDCYGNVVLNTKYQQLYVDTVNKNDIFYYAKDNGKIGLFDYKGKMLIPVIYDEIYPLKSGANSTITKYFVSILGKSGIIDNTGKLIIPTIYEHISSIDTFYLVKQNSYFGLLNEKGVSILPIKYGSISKFSNSLFLVKINKYGLVTPQNKFILQPVYDSVGLILNYGYLVKQNGLFGIISNSGLTLVPIKYKKIQLSSFGNIPFREVDVAYCLSGDRVQAYSLSTGRLLAGEDRIMKTNIITEDLFSNSIKDFSCKFSVKLPVVSWKFYDNRELCEWCPNNYRKYSLNENAEAILFEKRYRSDIYLSDLLQTHFDAINASEEHQEFDRSRANKIIYNLYGTPSNSEAMALAYGSAFRPLAIVMSELISSFYGTSIDLPKLKYGEIPRYKEISKFCSNECEWKSKRSKN